MERVEYSASIAPPGLTDTEILTYTIGQLGIMLMKATLVAPEWAQAYLSQLPSRIQDLVGDAARAFIEDVPVEVPS